MSDSCLARVVLALAFAFGAVGCSTAVKIQGEQTLRGRLTVQVNQAWNKLASPDVDQPYESWPQGGLALAPLRLWAGIPSGQPLREVSAPANGAKPARVPVLRAGMAPDQLANLFEVLYGVDGSAVRLVRLEPVVFAGTQGLRFELLVVRANDEVHLSVAGWVSVHRDELHALTYAAPRLGFFRRGLPAVEAIAASARLR